MEMKQIGCFFAALLLFLAGSTVEACAQNDRQARKARRQQAVAQALEARHFLVDIDRMLPLRGRSHSLSMLYSVEVRNDSLFSYLPYVGRAFSIPYGGGDGLIFEAPITDYRTEPVKKGGTCITVEVRTSEDTYTYQFTVYPDGTVSLYVQPRQRDAINFQGELDTTGKP